MAIRFLSGETIDGALTVNNTITLSGSSNAASTFTLTNTAPDPDSTWTFVPQYNSQDLVITGTGKFDVVSSGGTGRIDTNGQIESIQALDVATAGGRLTGKSNRGYLASIHLEQTATSADGGYIRFLTAASATTSGLERFRITETGAFSVGPSGTNYGTSGQVLTSQGNALPTWTTPTTGTITGSGVDTQVSYWTSSTNITGNNDFIWNNTNKDLTLQSPQVAAGDASLNVYGYDGAARLYTTRAESGFNTSLYLYNQPETGAGTGTGIMFRARSDSTDGQQQATIYSSWTTNTHASRTAKLVFQTTDSTTTSDKMTILGNGNVGINTTNPTYRLSIEHSGASGGIRTVAGFSAGTGNMSGDGSQINLTNWGDNYGGFIRTVNTQSTPNYLQPKMEFGLNFSNYLPADMITRMTILGNGNVGIGTTSPATPLDVAGAITAGGTITCNNVGSDKKIAFRRTGGNNFSIEQDTSRIYFYNETTPANMLTILNGGNVGIGTASPATKLHLEGTAPLDSIIRQDSTTSGTNWEIGERAAGKWQIWEDDGDTVVTTFMSTGNVGIGTTSPSELLTVNGTIQLGNGGGGGYLKYNTGNLYIQGTSNIVATFESTGNVGIGTTSPEAKLDISNVAGATYALEISTPERNRALFYYNSASTSDAGYLGIKQGSVDALNHRLATTGNSAVCIEEGNFGIGTDSPNKALTVYGGNDNGIWIDSQGAQYTSLAFGHNGSEKANISWDNTNGYTNISTYGNGHLALTTGGGIKAFLSYSGNFGIGTTGPSYKLDVTDFTQTQGLLNGATIEDVKTSTYFTHGTADLNFDIDLGNISYWGELEVSITGSYSNQNTPGRLTRIYALGLNASNSIYTNESRISESLGAVAGNVYLDVLRWDSATSTYKIRVAHLNSNGNAYNVRINGFTYGAGYANLVGWSLTGLYTQSVSGLSSQYPYYNSRLGIGTDSPLGKLHIQTASTGQTPYAQTDQLVIENTGNSGIQFLAGTTSFTGMFFGDSGSATQGQLYYNNNDDSFTMITNATTGSGIFINSSGNVGIGTDAPSTILHVESTDPIITLERSNHGSAAGAINFQGNDNGVDWQVATNHAVGLGFEINEGSDTNNRFYIAPGGNVGIGTTAPTSLFHVSGNSYLLGASYGVYGNADSANYHIKGSASGSQLIIKWYSGVLWQGNGTTDIMHLDNTGDLTVKGDVIAYGSPSDKRLKENIKPIESALDKVQKLQGVTFDWKKQKQTTEGSVKREWKHDTGFIAQDVKKIIPELVRENEDGLLSMRHQGVIPILVEAIKEQQKQIDRLEEQIKKMSSKN